MKERQSSIELLRIIAMLMIVLQHANYGALGPIERVDIINNPCSSFIRMLYQQICIVGVNVFILISGWFGIKPTIKGLLKLLYQIFFFGVSILFIGLVAGLPVPVKDVLYVFYGGGYYWFVPAYLCLFCIAPVLNMFIEKANPRTIINVLVLFFILEFSFGWLTSHITYNNGHSIVSFIGLYLLARFVSTYGSSVKAYKSSFYSAAYVLLTIVPVLLAFGGLKTINRDFFPTEYCSPFVVLASLSLILCFSKIQLSNKAINWVACSVFPVYIVHQHPMLAQHFYTLIVEAYKNMGVLLYVPFTIALGLLLLLGCVLVDKLRIITWELLYQVFFNKVTIFIKNKLSSFYLKLGY